MFINSINNINTTTKLKKEFISANKPNYKGNDIFSKSKNISFTAYRGADGYGTQADREALKISPLTLEEISSNIKKIKNPDEILIIADEAVGHESKRLDRAIKSYVSIHKDYDENLNSRIKEIVVMRVLPSKTPYKGSFSELLTDSKGRADAETLDVVDDFVQLFNRHVVDGLMPIYKRHEEICKFYYLLINRFTWSQLKQDIQFKIADNDDRYREIFEKLNGQIGDFVNHKLIDHLPKGFQIVMPDNKLLLRKL